MLRLIEGGLAASLPASVHDAPAHESWRNCLREHVERLRLIQSVVSISVMALRRQDAERDEDIASVLDQHAATQLCDEVFQLEDLLDRTAGGIFPRKRDGAASLSKGAINSPASVQRCPQRSAQNSSCVRQ